MEEIMEEVCGDTGWATAWAVTTAPPIIFPKAEPWAPPLPISSEEPPVPNRILEHLPERRRVMRVARGFEIKTENGRVVVMQESVYWKVRDAWTGGFKGGAKEMINEIATAMGALEEGAKTGNRKREEKMCWSNPTTFLDIMVDLAGLTIEAYCDQGNRFERFQKWYTLEDPGKLNKGGTIRKDGMQPEAWEGQRTYGNPMFNKEDEKTGGTDDVREAIRMASTAERAVLVIPLFETANYEALITHHGGKIIFTAPKNTWAFVPDGHWKGKARKKVGWIAKRIGVVLFQSEADSLTAWNPSTLEEGIRLWWAAQAPGEHSKVCREKTAEMFRTHGVEGYDDPDKKADWPAELEWYKRWDQVECEVGTWGAGRDSRDGGNSWNKCATWDEEYGAMGYVPPGLDQVLQGLGAGKKEAKDAVKRMKDISRGAFHEIWKVRCEEQQKAEQEAGITEELKRDREGAKAYRRARWEHNGVNYELEEEEGTPEGEPDGTRWGRMMERLQAVQRNQVERVTRQMENMKIEMPEKYKRVKEKEKGTHKHHKGGCGRIIGIRCGHALCWNLNGPRDNRCGKCKGKMPKWGGPTWLPKQAVYREREQDELWAVVSGTEYRGSPQGKRKWEEMGWGVARRFGLRGPVGVGRKRPRDRGRGTLESEEESAGPRGGARAEGEENGEQNERDQQEEGDRLRQRVE